MTAKVKSLSALGRKVASLQRRGYEIKGVHQTSRGYRVEYRASQKNPPTGWIKAKAVRIVRGKGGTRLEVKR